MNPFELLGKGEAPYFGAAVGAAVGHRISHIRANKKDMHSRSKKKADIRS